MFKKITAIAFALAVLAACSSGSKSSLPNTIKFPVTMSTQHSGQVRIDQEPKSIISLSPSATEGLYAVGAGDQVKAVDKLSNYPDAAPDGTLDAYSPNAEAILALKPDLVILSNDMNNIVASLKKAKVPVLIEPAAKTLDDAYFQILEIGIATGHDGDANSYVNNMKKEVTDIQATLSTAGKKTSAYIELDNTYYSATSSTLIGSLLTQASGTNIADKAPGASSGYPQLSAEYVVKANPQVIFLTDTKCCAVTKESLAKRPGFSGISAVKNNNVAVIDDDIAQRWGPRVIDLYKQIVDAINAANK